MTTVTMHEFRIPTQLIWLDNKSPLRAFEARACACVESDGASTVVDVVRRRIRSERRVPVPSRDSRMTSNKRGCLDVRGAGAARNPMSHPQWASSRDPNY